MAANSMYLYGKNSVAERLKANPKTIKKIFLQNNFNASELLDLIKSSGIPTKYFTQRDLSRIKRADRLQGIVAEIDRFNYTPFERLLDNKGLSLIFVDNINDPHNLGSIIRTAACFGKFAVIIPRHSSCEVNDTVMHVASGGENFAAVSVVNNMSTALIKAKKAGFWVAGAVVEDGENVSQTSLPFPLCLVLGSEGKGIRHGVKKQLDLRISLPMSGAPLSFNVAMACAMFCYEIVRQKHYANKN